MHTCIFMLSILYSYLLRYPAAAAPAPVVVQVEVVPTIEIIPHFFFNATIFLHIMDKLNSFFLGFDDEATHTSKGLFA